VPVIEHKEIRFEQLDGLRGMAAFVVFLFHAIMMAPPDFWGLRILNKPFIRPFWDGPGAVMLFFVLSGFVLTLPYAGKVARKIEPIPFLIRRIARLYPAYWAVLIIAVVLRFFAFNPDGLAGLSPWTSLHWSQPVSWQSAVSHVFMISPRLQVDDIDPVIWSLIIEMKVSIVFPLLILLVARTTRIIYALLAIIGGIALTTPLHFVTHSSSSWARAAILLPVFLFGSYLARFRNELISGLRTSRWIRIAVGIAGAVLYSMAWIMPIGMQSLARWGCALGSGAFILLFLVSARLQALGTIHPIRFLGKVSFSFYLIHLPILLTVASLLMSRNHSFALICAISLVITLFIAWVLYALVEMPTHLWGKRLASTASTAAQTRAVERVAG
jgi:peptidoglycan/LPS O-acetylase OafA/YrhL